MKSICPNCGASVEGTHACSRLINQCNNWEQEQWEEEFEAISIIYPEDAFVIKNCNKTFGNLFRKYMSENQIKVRIKTRQGKIVIERID